MTDAAHGTLTSYTNGCRCGLCREASTNYQREYRRRKADPSPLPYERGLSPRALIGYPDAAGRLQALCWCQRRTVWVPADAIRAGRTGSCGNKECRPSRSITPELPRRERTIPKSWALRGSGT